MTATFIRYLPWRKRSTAATSARRIPGSSAEWPASGTIDNRAEGHAADAIAAQVLLHLAGQLDRRPVRSRVDLERVVNAGELILGKLGIKRRADDLRNFSGGGHIRYLVFVR